MKCSFQCRCRWFWMGRRARGREGARAREQESKRARERESEQDMVRKRAVRVMCVIMCGCMFWHVLAWHRMCIWTLAPVSLPNTPSRARRSSEICSTLYVSQLWWVDYSYNDGGFLLPRNGYSRDKKLEGKQTCVHTTQRYIFTYVLLH